MSHTLGFRLQQTAAVLALLVGLAATALGQTYRVLHNFETRVINPTSALIADPAGTLYGTTSTDNGAIFRLDTSGQLTILHFFQGLDGAGPRAALVRDASGNLYGTTSGGGA